MDKPPIPDTLYDPRKGGFVRTKSLTRLMAERIPKKVLNILADLGRVGDGLGYNVYAVGGFVRDLLLRRDNLDVDVVVEATGSGSPRSSDSATGPGCGITRSSGPRW